MRKLTMLLLGCLAVMWAQAQETFPVNGTTDPREGYYAFINATIVKDAQTTLQNAVLIIKQGKIVSAGSGIAVPKEAVVIDLKGKYIYPSFIDLYSDYGISSGQPQGGRGGGGRGGFQNVSNTKGAYGWNEAIKSEIDAFKLFANNESKAKDLRSAGFGTVLTHQQDGIARGTGALVTLGTERENFGLIKERAAAFYSFNKGSSTQDYPNSLMGSIALLRQTYLDGQWYKTHPSSEGTNLSLEAWNNNLALPQIFDANDKWNDLRAAKIGTEYGVQYIIKGGGNEYQRIDDIKATKAAYIIPINFPQVLDVEDPNDARLVALSALKHWEMAPTEPGALEKAGVTFALTTADLKDAGDFMGNLRKAITNGLSETKALEALTKIPATLIGVYDKVGSIEEGKLANFIITSGPVFNEKTVFYQNWVLGEKYVITDNGWNDYRGNYTLTVKQAGQEKQYTLEVSGKPGKTSASLKAVGDTVKTDVNLSISNNIVKINWSTKPDSTVKPPVTGLNSLSGVIADKNISGDGYSSTGNLVSWSMVLSSPYVEKADTAKKHERETGKIKDVVTYPFNGFGWVEAPKQEDILIKNTTVWTNEKEGELQNTDVLIKAGKIAAIGKNLSAGGATVIDGTGKHLSAGIIDEHSHIAVSGGVNECSQSVTAEVRIADVILPDDINIYRQLAGGVTSSHILHGSCNTIGGQTQLIKLRWGQDAENLKFANWDPFIKFALGENVKRSYGSSNNRFPDTRMGVEQVLVDEFQRGKDYQALGTDKRRDLELDAISEILNHKRFITCHSYVQSEINMLMHVGDKFGFQVNTFTHILEGYKVADKMKQRGIAASTFSDWWAYKSEVQDAIPYNAAIMHNVGLIVAINSDDAEQARHLNQESAKTIKYGNVSEEEALKMCTLNPATMLHVADRTGSIKVGKDADVVLWSDNPLSIYAKAEKTIVDGVVYFDLQKDSAMRVQIAAERNRLIQKMISEKKKGAKTSAPEATIDEINECEIDTHIQRNILLRNVEAAGQ